MTTLASKLLLKAGRAAIVGAPSGYLELLGVLPAGVELVPPDSGGLDFLQVFVADLPALRAAIGTLRNVKPDGLLWVCYPKGGRRSGTDLNRDILWAELDSHGLTGVTLVAIDEIWSAMRFRPAGQLKR